MQGLAGQQLQPAAGVEYSRAVRMGVGDVVYHEAADLYRKINETGFSRPSDQSAVAFVVTHAWVVCLIGEPCCTGRRCAWTE